MMTRKIFIKLADAVKENILNDPNNKDEKPKDVDLNGLIDSLSYVCICDNRNFDKQRFYNHIMKGTK